MAWHPVTDSSSGSEVNEPRLWVGGGCSVLGGQPGVSEGAGEGTCFARLLDQSGSSRKKGLGRDQEELGTGRAL